MCVCVVYYVGELWGGLDTVCRLHLFCQDDKLTRLAWLFVVCVLAWLVMSDFGWLGLVVLGWLGWACVAGLICICCFGLALIGLS